MKELIFSYINERCHAPIVEHLDDDTEYRLVGSMDGYDIYQIKTGLFNQFGFVAVKGGIK